MSELHGADEAEEPDDKAGGRGPNEAGGGPDDKAGPQPPHEAGGGRGDYPGAVPRGGLRGYSDAVGTRIALEDQLLPPRQEYQAAVNWSVEKAPGAGHDGDDGTRTGEDRPAPDADDGAALDSGAGERDRAASGEVPPAAGRPGDQPAGAPGADTGAPAERGDGSAWSAEASPAWAAGDADSVAEAGAGKQPATEPGAGQAGELAGPGAPAEDGRAAPDTAPDVGLRGLTAELAGTLQDAKADRDAARTDREAARGMLAEFQASLADVKGMKAQYEAGLKDVQERGATYEANLNELKADHEAKLAEQAAKYEAGIEELKVGYAARMNEFEARTEKLEADNKDLKAELQALKDGRQGTPDAPAGAEEQAGQPRLDDYELPEGQRNQKEAEPQDDKPGLWSNAKYQLYGAFGGAMVSAFISEVVLDSPAGALIAIVSAVPSVIGAFVPVVREGWRRKRDDSPAKP